MTWIDWVIVIAMVLGVLAGFEQGFLRSAFSVGGLLAGLVLAAWNYHLVADWLERWISESAAGAIGFLLITVAVMAAAGVAGGLLANVVHGIGLGCLDRLAGGVFGLLQGYLTVSVFILVAVAFFPEARWLGDSKLPRQFFGVCHLSTHVTPSELTSRIRHGLKTLEEESPRWLHPRPARS